MILGQAAGVAAKIAIERRQAVQDVDTNALAAKLRSQRAVLHQPAQGHVGAYNADLIGIADAGLNTPLLTQYR